MHYIRYAAIALLVLTPSIASAATGSWQKATANSVVAGVNSKSTFVVQAQVALPNQCYMARIVSSPISMHMHRYFTVMEMAPSGVCAQKSLYTCTVVSPSFPLPIPTKFEADSKGKKWEVHLGTEAPAAAEPMCKKG
ncbi:MAG TPA: hypothetical protein VHR97_06720 [Candidatus Baltobacteraceae bacterium]|jgi:hypothetical protein|nr:hypothetical protein [Candidatus Baltobacteraceae bacterium]